MHPVRHACRRYFLQLLTDEDDTGALWSEKYSPTGLDTLCVHNKKVADVRRWLEEAYAGGGVSKYRVSLSYSLGDH